MECYQDWYHNMIEDPAMGKNRHTSGICCLCG